MDTRSTASTLARNDVCYTMVEECRRICDLSELFDPNRGLTIHSETHKAKEEEPSVTLPAAVDKILPVFSSVAPEKPRFTIEGADEIIATRTLKIE